MAAKQGPTVKIKPASKQVLERIADDLKAQQIDVLGWAMDALLNYYEHHDKRLLLPLKFTESFQIIAVGAPPNHRPPAVVEVTRREKPARSR